VPIAQCVIEKRDCLSCLPAATVVAKAVREGLAAEQVRDLYKARFDPASAPKAIPLDGSPTRGPSDAPVTLVEFADFECPFCRHIAPELDKLWTSRSTSIRFVFKFMPLAVHAHGEIAARAAVAAQAQGKFWEMHHALFADGSQLEQSDLESAARAVGLDVERFRVEMRSPATEARLKADRKLADDLGVKGTPTLFINGRQYDARLDLSEWVDGEIASASRENAAREPVVAPAGARP
jgi:protein-disulfide isomerase